MKTILLTGSQGGIGSVIKEILEKGGNTVVGVDRGDADLSSYGDIKKLEEKISHETPLFDWIVFAHGFIDAEGDIEKEKPEDISATFQLNIVSIVYLAQLFLKHLKPSGGMVALSSTAALTANGRHAVYSASKGAVNVFMQALARNKPEHTFISICPGPTNTEMRTKIGADRNAAQDPAEVASVVGEIISGTSPYVSGDIVVVRDGNVSVAAHIEK